VLLILVSDFKRLKKHKNFYNIEKLILRVLIYFGLASFVTAITSSYFWFDNKDFLSSIHYESSVALGSLPVFYSQIFQKTTPLIYQTIKVYPFILNPFVATLSFFLFFYVLKKAFKNKDFKLLILIAFFLVALFSQVFLFVKWIRYYIPTLSFLYVITGFGVVSIIKNSKATKKQFLQITLFLILGISLLYSIAFVKTVLFDQDTRLTASFWAKKYIKGNPKILSEVYDLGIVPFNPYFTSIKLFNFYELENERIKQVELADELAITQYIIIPSQRIIESRISKPSLFPIGNTFYKKLTNGDLGFSKVYETPCDMLCRILYLGNPIYSYEQTASVFDRPTVLIFKKN
jgi:multisubunit Na+/H+ antiporter MnhB subunit